MDPIFAGEQVLRWLENTAAWLFSEVFTSANMVYTAMQIPAVVGTGFSAWWVHDFVYPILAERIKRSSLTDYGKGVLLNLVSLIFPVLWLMGLGIAHAVAVHFGWPHDLARIAINLLAAWIAIRLASLVVRDPIWSRAVVIVAYTIAVLNILHLLEPALAVLDSLAVTMGRLRISVLTVLEWMLSFGVLLWVSMLVSAILERRIRRLPNLTPSVQVLIGKLFKATMITMAIIVSLTSIGIDFTALAVFSGALGVGIGFGLQRIASNLIGGVMLLMDKSIKPGDIIQVGNTYGWVSSLGARYVAVETRDGTEFLIPNEDMITQQVINWSHRNDLARIKVQARISYDTDVEHALKLMVMATDKPARVLKRPAPRGLLLGFEESYMELELRFWIRDVQNGIRNVSSEVMLEIWRLFREHGIRVPMPRRELFVQSLPPVTTAAGAPDSAASGGAQPPSLAKTSPSFREPSK